MLPEVIPIADHAERAVPEQASAILAAGLVAYVGFAHDGLPYVIPMNYQYDPAEPATLYLHGAGHRRLMGVLASGMSVCVAVSLLDGLVYSKTRAFTPSIVDPWSATALEASSPMSQPKQRSWGQSFLGIFPVARPATTICLPAQMNSSQQLL